MTGPYRTRNEVSRSPEVRAIRAAYEQDHRDGVIIQGCLDLLTGACQQAGVELAAFDHRILHLAASAGTHESAVIADLIRRAYEAGRAVAGGES
jgi:hypothetical protein